MIEVLQAGFYTTIQDHGRWGFRKWGVPVSGPMDRAAADLANQLVHNSAEEPVIEISLQGPELRFEETLYFALTGGEPEAFLDSTPLSVNTAYKAEAGQVLKVGRCTRGVRAYLAIQGGLQTEEVLGSRSYYSPISSYDRLQKGMTLEVSPSKGFEPRIWAVKQKPVSFGKPLEVFPGPEFELFPQEIQSALFDRSFHIAKENNRMAYQLEELLPAYDLPMLTSVTLPGTVQLTTSGRLIILMRDAQTTGGYPRVLQLTEESINQLAQRSTGHSVQFLALE